MQVRSLALIVLPFVSAICFAQAGEQEHSLLPNVAVGDKVLYNFKGVSTISGSESTFTAHYEMTIASLDPKGTITFKTGQTNTEFVTAGKVQKVPDSTTTTKFKLNGEMISSEPAFASSAQARFSQLMQIVVPEDKASVGSKWAWKAEPTEANGMTGLEGNGECVAFESRGGIACAKVHLTAKETSGDKPASGTMDVWVSLKDGLPVETDIELLDIPFAPGVSGNMKGTNKRTG